MAVARVHVRSWQVAYRTLMPDEYLDQLRPEDRAPRYTFGSPDPLKPWTIVAIEGGTIHGFATSGFATRGFARDPELSNHGELYALYVDPDQWGRGIGFALASAARARLVDLGCRQAILWVLAGNVRAERVYLKDGWATDGGRRTEVVWGAKCDEIRYRRSLETR